ncbi:30S ribosomal protein S20 [Candidatus Microgenomates bacterium]|nr:30S ribosomal protein S20 [Candidatus Microgenomates bacterium]
MPIIKSAIKKQRQDVKRTSANKKYDHEFKKALRDVRKGTAKSLTEVYSKIDKAAKKNVIHKKKASRLKSLASRMLNRAK